MADSLTDIIRALSDHLHRRALEREIQLMVFGMALASSGAVREKILATDPKWLGPEFDQAFEALRDKDSERVKEFLNGGFGIRVKENSTTVDAVLSVLRANFRKEQAREITRKLGKAMLSEDPESVIRDVLLEVQGTLE